MVKSLLVQHSRHKPLDPAIEAFDISYNACPLRGCYARRLPTFSSPDPVHQSQSASALHRLFEGSITDIIAFGPFPFVFPGPSHQSTGCRHLVCPALEIIQWGSSALRHKATGIPKAGSPVFSCYLTPLLVAPMSLWRGPRGRWGGGASRYEEKKKKAREQRTREGTASMAIARTGQKGATCRPLRIGIAKNNNSQRGENPARPASPANHHLASFNATAHLITPSPHSISI